MIDQLDLIRKEGFLKIRLDLVQPLEVDFTTELSLYDAKRALYLDFKGTVNDALSLFGTLMMSDDSAEYVTQYVTEEALYPAP